MLQFDIRVTVRDDYNNPIEEYTKEQTLELQNQIITELTTNDIWNIDLGWIRFSIADIKEVK